MSSINNSDDVDIFQAKEIYLYSSLVEKLVSLEGEEHYESAFDSQKLFHDLIKHFTTSTTAEIMTF